MRSLITCLMLAVSSVASAQVPAVDGPAVFLDGVPFTLTVTNPGLDPVVVVIRTADGAELARRALGPVESTSVRNLEVTARSQLPLVVEAAGERTEMTAPFLPAWFSVLPPLLAIVLALVFREVITSLFLGVWLGALFVAGYNPLAALLMTVDRFIRHALADPDRAAVVIFSLLLGGMVGVMSRMGGTRAIVDAVTPLATTQRRAQLAAWLAGLAIFFDDYANTLLVGNTMRPLTDRLQVSREKLAYIVDSTAAPVAAIVFVSTWVGYEISLIGDGLRFAAEQEAAGSAAAAALSAASPFAVFLQSIPYLFYPLFAIATVALIAVMQRDFGPMLAAERRAFGGGGVFRPGAQLAANLEGEVGEAPEGTPLRWWNGAIPVVAVVVTVLAGLVWTGLQGSEPAGPESLMDTVRRVVNNADPFATLLWGSLVGAVTAVVLATSQRILTVADAMASLVGGMKAMMLAMIILVLAWSLGEVTSDLQTASFLSGVLSDRLPLELVPAAVFVVAALMAFATGTSWATMAVLMPLIIPLAVALGAGVGGGAEHGILVGGIASVLAGAIFGDHCSPISDTTVLSSMASGCDHVDHVRTQLPYALLGAAIALVVMLPLNLVFGSSPWAAMAMVLLGWGLIAAVIRFVGRRSDVTLGEGQLSR
ncbi:MAG TPA: Na+/H+ antiporter NhaC family protein [Gemmatimonadales bacterium]